MAKRYYSSDESKNMNRDAGMIREDRSAPCLLPRQVIDKDWPRTEVYMKEGAADLFMGVQKQMSQDKSDMNKASAQGPHKY